MVTRSPSAAPSRPRWAEGAALLAQDLDGAVDGGLGHLGGDALNLGLAQVADLDLRVHLEGGVEGHLAFGRLVLLLMRARRRRAAALRWPR